PYLKRVPDGEVGPRRHWFTWQQPLLMKNPFLAPDPSRIQPYGGGFLIGLAADARPEDIRIGELGYAREARSSYADFKEAQRQGALPAGLRFQVSLPTPYAVVNSFCLEAARAAILPAYEQAMIAEVKRLADRVPPRELAIQWDVCIEMIQWDGRLAAFPATPALADTLRAAFARLARAVPPEAELGFHLCYGDPEGKHVIEPQDCTRMVELANLIAAAAGRPVAFIHLPMDPAREDDAFYAPLAGLALAPETEIHLGLVHASDGIAGAKRRMAVARKVLPRFGIATPCGMNRAKRPETVLELMRIQAGAAAD
ncbi:MAG: hypothetical protein ACREFQ_08700, partial [Stellaceae bacterium]